MEVVQLHEVHETAHYFEKGNGTGKCADNAGSDFLRRFGLFYNEIKGQDQADAYHQCGDVQGTPLILHTGIVNTAKEPFGKAHSSHFSLFVFFFHARNACFAFKVSFLNCLKSKIKEMQKQIGVTMTKHGTINQNHGQYFVSPA